MSEPKEDVLHAEQLPALSAKAAKHAEQVDEDVARYADASTGIHIDPKTNKRLFWKINSRILLVMLGTYFCQSLDKGALTLSSIMGIEKDAHLVGEQYNWLGTILYMGILVGEYPTNLLLQRFLIGKYLAFNVFCWGVVITCSAAAKNFPGLMVVRFLLGLFESCVQPTFIIMTAIWYTREEQSVLTSLWYCMTGLQLMVGGLIAYGVSHLKNAVISSWQLLFMVLGLATVVWSLFVAWYVPDSPMTAKCFTEEEKHLMMARIRNNETGVQNKKYKKYQMLEAFTDPLIWCYVLLQVSSTLVIGGLGVFSNLIISNFGFSTLQTQLLNIAQGGVTILVMVGSAWLSQHIGQTCLVMLLWSIPAIVGTAVLMRIAPNESNSAGLLIAFYCTQFILAEGNMIFSLISRNIAGQTKKGITLTITFVAWAAGNMTAPQIFQSSDKPRYQHGFTAHICLYVIFDVMVAITWVLLSRRNKAKRADAAATASAEGDSDENKTSHGLGFQDLTDIENPDFRYVS